MAIWSRSKRLRRAKQFFIEKGWVQHNTFRRDAFGNVTGMCAVGAIVAADNEMNDMSMTFEAVLDPKLIMLVNQAIGRGNVNDPGYITGWNDQATRRKEEVIEAFEKAAQLADQEDEPPVVKIEDLPEVPIRKEEPVEV